MQPVVSLPASQLELAADLAARAFMEDPGMAYAFRAAGRREARLRELLASVVRYGLRYGEVYTTSGAPRGVAVWAPPPGRASVSYPRMARAGMLRPALRCRPDELLRLLFLSGRASLLDVASHHTPHWYLWLLAVDPDHQGMGVGGSLLAPVLRRADSQGLPCALETMTPRNVEFYRRRGFRVSGYGRLPSGGPEIWTMWRDPRPAGEDPGR